MPPSTGTEKFCKPLNAEVIRKKNRKASQIAGRPMKPKTFVLAVPPAPTFGLSSSIRGRANCSAVTVAAATSAAANPAPRQPAQARAVPDIAAPKAQPRLPDNPCTEKA
jgi:hypothetical protein